MAFFQNLTGRITIVIHADSEGGPCLEEDDYSTSGFRKESERGPRETSCFKLLHVEKGCNDSPLQAR